MIKGIAYVAVRKPGKPVRHYFYAWRGGPCIMSRVGGPKPKLDKDALAAYQSAVDEQQQSKADTFPGLIAAYRRSEEWKALAANTRRVWGGILDRIEERWKATSVKLWSDPRMVGKIVEWRDSMAATPRAADNGVTVLRSLLEWARLRTRVTINVAANIPQIYGGGDRAEIIWTSDDLKLAQAKANRAIMDGIRLACMTGLRREDLVGLRLDEIKDQAIVRVTLKSSNRRGEKRKPRRAIVPLYPELRRLIGELKSRPRKEGVETLLVTSEGNSWSGDGFGKRVGEAVRKAGIVHDDGRFKHLHDCRGTFATHLILAGLTDQEAAGVLGWSPERVANIRKVYVDDMKVVVALADRISGGPAKRAAKRGAGK